MKKSLFFLAALLTLGMAANAQTAWSEDFENVTIGSNGIGSLPEGWGYYEDNITNFYSESQGIDYRPFGNSWSVYNFGWYGQSAFCMTYTNVTTPCERWMVTPQISIPAEGNYSLYFDLYASQYNEVMSVLLSTTGTEKADFTEVLMPATTLPAGEQAKLFDMSSFAGQNVYIAFKCTTTDGLYTVIDNIAVKVVPANAIACVGVSAPGYAPMGENFNFDVTVYNEGSAPLTSFQIDYTVGNGSQQTANVTGVNVAPFTYYTHTLSASVATASNTDINVTVSLPNGEADVDASDNSASTSLSVYDPSTTTQRTVVMEHFTTARCPNCPSGHERIGAAYQSVQDRVVWIAHHVGYYTDNMTIPESNQMLDFFNDGGSTFAPAWMLDRSYDNVNNKSENPGPAFFPDGTESAVLNNALSRPAFASVSISDIDYNTSTRQLSVTVSGQFVSDVNLESPRLSLYIMEDGIMGTQSGANGQYEHNHVIRGCISDVWGDSDAITSTTSGSTFSKTFTYTLPATWRANKCWLAAFVNNYSANVMNREILNGTKSGYLTNVGIEDVEMEASLSLTTYPNPASEMAFVRAESTIHSYEMVDAMGRRVMGAENIEADALELNVSGLAQGVYFLSVVTDKGIATDRLSIVK